MEILATHEKGLQRAVEILRAGGIGAYPTDTVYGLGARIDLEAAIARVFAAKGRDYRQPLPVLIADSRQLSLVAAKVPPIARKLAQRFWPGGLTLVLFKSPGLSSLIAAGGDTVAVRLPGHPVPVALSRGLGVPITGTSANISGHPSPVTAGDVAAQLADLVDFIIDGGRCPGGRESTIVDLTRDPPLVLREGAIPKEEVEKALAELGH